MKKVVLFLFAMLLVSAAYSVNKVWNGPVGDPPPAGTNSWMNPLNWVPNGVPAPGDKIIFNGGGTYVVVGIPWYQSVPPYNALAGNGGGWGAGDLWGMCVERNPISNAATTVRLRGSGNVELRFTGVPTLASPETFCIDNGCRLDLTNPDGQKVALDLACNTYSELDPGSQLDVGLPFEFPLGGISFSVHALKLEACCGQTSGGGWNVAFRQMNTNPIQNVFVQFEVCCKNEWHFYSPPVTPSMLCCTFKTDYVFQYDNSINPGNAWVRVPGSLPWPTEVGRGYEMLDPIGVTDPPIWLCNCPPLQGGTYTSYHVFNGVLNSYAGLNWSLFGGPIIGGINQGTGWELIGNPYAVAIDLPPTPGWTGLPGPGQFVGPNWVWKSEIDPSIWIWQDICDLNPATGVYLYYNFLTGLTLNYPGGVAQGRIIPAMQGFFVFRNALPMSGLNNLQLFQGAQVPRNWTLNYKDEETPSNRLNVTLSGNGLEDETAVFFWQNATTNYEGYLDGVKLFSSGDNPQIYANTADNVKVCADALPLGNCSVPLGILVGTDGDYSITAKNISSFSPYAEILLTDTKLNTTQDLKANPVYNFTATAGEDPARFLLFFSNLLGVDNKAENVSKIYSVGSDIYVQMTDLNNKGSVIVYDMIGKKVQEKSLDNSIITQLKTNLTNGIYVVSVVTNKGSYNQRVYIN